MNLLHMLIVCFLFLEVEITLSTLDFLAEMDHFDVTVKVMLISKTHDAVFAFVVFDIRVRDHVSFEV